MSLALGMSKEEELSRRDTGLCFSCLASRAVHIELADSLEMDSFINALRGFICRWGPAREMRCDRGTNFIGPEELKKAIEEMDDQKIKVELLKESINWIKNPASAHNFGCLGKTNKVNQKRHEWTHQRTQQLPGRRFTEDLPLQNGVHNQQQTSDSGDSKRPPLSAPRLSPSMLLTGKTRLVLPPHGKFRRGDLYCRKRWRCTQHLTQEFWSRWCKDFLQQLQTRNKWIRPRRNFQVGDAVLLKLKKSSLLETDGSWLK